MLGNNDTYWHGPKNKAIRFYFYTQRGLSVLNEFRNLIFAMIGLYAVLKLDNPLWFAVMFVPSILILLLVGWVSVHHMGKVIDWLNVKYSTHYSLYQYQLLEEIRDAIKQKEGGDTNGRKEETRC